MIRPPGSRVRVQRSGVTRLLLAFAFSVPVLGVGVAYAQEPGVRVDPDSPAGTEYAVPLESGRREGAPGSGNRSSNSPTSNPNPAFGAGISAQGRRQSGSRSEPAESSASERGRDGTGSPADAGDRAISRAASASGSDSADDGLSPSLVTIAVALGVLLLGGLAALVLRALRESQ